MLVSISLLVFCALAFMASVNATQATTIQIFQGTSCAGNPVATNVLSLASCTNIPVVVAGSIASFSLVCGEFKEFLQPDCTGNPFSSASFSGICIQDAFTGQSYKYGCSNVNLVNLTLFETGNCTTAAYSTLVQANVCQGSTGSTFVASGAGTVDLNFKESWKIQVTGNSITADFFQNSGTCSGNPTSTFTVSETGSCSSTSSSGSGTQTASITAQKLGSNGAVAKLSATLIVALVTLCVFLLWALPSYQAKFFNKSSIYSFMSLSSSVFHIINRR